MTEKLYYKDADKCEFTARVIDILMVEKGWKVVLDQTCFFPEGGGQPADKGFIDDIPVTDVQKEGDVIYHYLPQKPAVETVHGKIDMDWRRDFMQQHTGQHIISGALWQVGKYKTVSVHMGVDYTTIEIEAPEISEEDLLNTETLANATINGNLPVRFIHTDHENVAKFPLRKPSARKGPIRLVMIGNFDCVACGGLHFAATGPVGLVKAMGVEKIRGNVRIAWKIGLRAFNDYRKKDAVIYQLKSLLSTSEDSLVQKTMELREEVSMHKKKCSALENRLVDLSVRDLYANRLQENGLGIITQAWDLEDELFVKKILKALIKHEKTLVCFVNVFPGQNRLQWSLGCSEDIDFPFDTVKEQLFSPIDGKGGGRWPMWQGSGTYTQAAADFLAAFKTIAATAAVLK